MDPPQKPQAVTGSKVNRKQRKILVGDTKIGQTQCQLQKRANIKLYSVYDYTAYSEELVTTTYGAPEM